MLKPYRRPSSRPHRGDGTRLVDYPHLVGKMVVAVVMVALLTLASANPAMAGPIEDAGVQGGSASVSSLCLTGSDTQALDLLPVKRWSASTGEMHSRLDTGPVGASAIGDSMWQSGAQISQSLGGWAWDLSVTVTQMAGKFCLLELAGGTIDAVAATVGNVLIEAGIPALAAVVIIITGLAAWRGRRRHLDVKAMVGKFLALGLMFAMVWGASHSTGGNAIGRDTVADDPGASAMGSPYRPGLLSPGWFIVKIDEAVTTVGSAPVALINDGIVSIEENADTGQGMLGCAEYTKAMRQLYIEQYGGKSKPMGAAPEIINSLWLMSGKPAYVQTQFGNDNPWADYVYCRQLEANADKPLRYDASKDAVDTSVESIMRRVGAFAPESWFDKEGVTESITWGPMLPGDIDEVEADRGMFAWAACRLKDKSQLTSAAGWEIADGARSLFVDSKDKSDQDLQKVCAEVFSTKAGNDAKGEVFDFPTKPSDFRTKIGEASVQASAGKTRGDARWATDWVSHWRGYGFADAWMANVSYAISGFATLFVFGLLALGVMAAKVFALYFGLMLIVHALIAAFSGPDKLAKAFKTYLGVSMFVLVAQLALTAIALLTRVLVAVIGMVLPHTSTISILLVGMAPLASLLILRRALQATGMPNIFSVTGAVEMGKAFGDASMANLMAGNTRELATAGSGSRSGGGSMPRRSGMSGTGVRERPERRSGIGGMLDSQTGRILAGNLGASVAAHVLEDATDGDDVTATSDLASPDATQILEGAEPQPGDGPAGLVATDGADGVVVAGGLAGAAASKAPTPHDEYDKASTAFEAARARVDNDLEWDAEKDTLRRTALLGTTRAGRSGARSEFQEMQRRDELDVIADRRASDLTIRQKLRADLQETKENLIEGARSFAHKPVSTLLSPAVKFARNPADYTFRALRAAPRVVAKGGLLTAATIAAGPAGLALAAGGMAAAGVVGHKAAQQARHTRASVSARDIAEYRQRKLSLDKKAAMQARADRSVAREKVAEFEKVHRRRLEEKGATIQPTKPVPGPEHEERTPEPAKPTKPVPGPGHEEPSPEPARPTKPWPGLDQEEPTHGPGGGPDPVDSGWLDDAPPNDVEPPLDPWEPNADGGA